MPAALRIGTLNVWALPWVSRRVEFRLHAVVQKAAELDLDILAMQEVWTHRAEEALRSAGAVRGYRSLWPSGRKAGGLMALSRLDTTAVAFREFTVRGLPQRFHHADYYGHKGFVVARLDTPSGAMSLVVTHLHARYAASAESDEYLGIRAAQVVELAEAVAAASVPVIAVGDFNLREGEAEYEGLLELTGMSDVAAALDNRQATVLGTNPYTGVGHNADERIDYVFASPGAVPLDVVRDFDRLGASAYSDHAGLVATIALTGEETPAPRTASAATAELGRLIRHAVTLAGQRRRSHRLKAGGLAAGVLLGVRARSPLIAAVLGAAALGEGALGERFVPAEIAGLQRAEQILVRLDHDSPFM